MPAAELPPISLPAGSRTVTAHRSEFPVGLESTNGVARLADVSDLDLNDPIANGVVLLRSGRYPARAGEALLSPTLARAFGVGVGDTLRLGDPAWTEKVVGLGQLATNWNDRFLAVRGNELTTRGQLGDTIASLALIDLPGHPTAAELLTYPGTYTSRASIAAQTPERVVNWVLVGGIVALAIIGIVISGAFAVGARRQLVTLGQLSANGADERLLRRTLTLQGLLSGAIGSAVGFTVGVALLLALQSHFSQWIHHDPGPYVWTLRDTVAVTLTGIIAATIAAFVPARSASRVPVLSALAGRRPLGTLPKRLVPIGAALFAGGIFVLVLVATAAPNRRSDGLALSAVFGGLLVLAGACCASSVVVAALGRVASSARGASLIAIRSIVRSRARSAAVVMAIAAISAGAIAIGTALDSQTNAKLTGAQYMPDDTLIVSSGGDLSGNVRQFLPPSAAVQRELRTILPAAHWSVRRAVVGSTPVADGPAIGSKIVGGPRDLGTLVPPIVTVVDPDVMQMLGLSQRDSAALEQQGAIAVQTFDVNVKVHHTIPVEIGTNPIRTITAALPTDFVHATGDAEGVFITEAKARALHLPIVDAGFIVRNPKKFDESQRTSIEVLTQRLYSTRATSSTSLAWSGTSRNAISRAAVREIVLGIVLVIVLIVLAMSLALSAAETRDERDILVSLGARPSTMRSVSAWKAALLAASGAAVAVPTGFIPVAVVYMAIANRNQTAHVVFPWSVTLQLVVIAPIIAGLVAYVGSAIAQAVRPTRMSTFATD